MAHFRISYKKCENRFDENTKRRQTAGAYISMFFVEKNALLSLLDRESIRASDIVGLHAVNKDYD